MNVHSFCAALFFLATVIGASTSHAVSYIATILQPTGFTDSSGNSVSGTTQVGYGSGPATSGLSNALLWSGTASSVVDLHPAGFDVSYAVGVSGANQVGYGQGTATSSNIHALLWSGSAGTVVDLNPIGLTVTYGLGISGSIQVGYGFSTDDFLSHALLWSGLAGSKVDLNPAGYTESFAYAVSGTSQLGYSQVGYGYGPSTDSNSHALLWNDTAESSVDLNPSNFTESFANAVFRTTSGTTEVGSGTGAATGGATHALLWTGTPTSKVDLHPTGFDFSEALGISSTGQVGDGFGDSTGGNYHALRWNGAAETAVDLHTFLSGLGPTFVSSTARSIAENGTIVGSATDDSFNNYAILWTPESGVLGDYNNNGAVDAADYVAWRKGNNPLHNEVATPGSNTAQDYTEWRARFGDPSAASAGLRGPNVPEPSSCALLSFAMALMSIRRKGKDAERRK
jgi:hypothetical protein